MTRPVVETERHLFSGEVVTDRHLVARHRAVAFKRVAAVDGHPVHLGLGQGLEGLHRPVDPPESLFGIGIRRRRAQVSERLELCDLADPFALAPEHVVLQFVVVVETQPHADLLSAVRVEDIEGHHSGKLAFGSGVDVVVFVELDVVGRGREGTVRLRRG